MQCRTGLQIHYKSLLQTYYKSCGAAVQIIKKNWPDLQIPLNRKKRPSVNPGLDCKFGSCAAFRCVWAGLIQKNNSGAIKSNLNQSWRKMLEATCHVSFRLFCKSFCDLQYVGPCLNSEVENRLRSWSEFRLRFPPNFDLVLDHEHWAWSQLGLGGRRQVAIVVGAVAWPCWRHRED